MVESYQNPVRSNDRRHNVSVITLKYLRTALRPVNIFTLVDELFDTLQSR